MHVPGAFGRGQEIPVLAGDFEKGVETCVALGPPCLQHEVRPQTRSCSHKGHAAQEILALEAGQKGFQSLRSAPARIGCKGSGSLRVNALNRALAAKDRLLRMF